MTSYMFPLMYASLLLFVTFSDKLFVSAAHVEDAVEAGQDLAETAVKESGPILDKTKELLEAASSAAEDFAEDPIMKSHFCKCQHQVCQCCSDIVYKRFGLNDVVCVNAEYYPSEPAVSANVSWDGKVIISDTLSARNPPDVCAEVPIPKLTNLLKLCLKLYNVEISNGRLRSCFELHFEALFIPIFTVHMGCTHFGSEENNWMCGYSHEDPSLPDKMRYSCVGTCNGNLRYHNSTTFMSAAEYNFDIIVEEDKDINDVAVKKDMVKNDEGKRYFKGECEFMADAKDPKKLCLLGCVPKSYEMKRLY